MPCTDDFSPIGSPQAAYARCVRSASGLGTCDLGAGIAQTSTSTYEAHGTSWTTTCTAAAPVILGFTSARQDRRATAVGTRSMDLSAEQIAGKRNISVANATGGRPVEAPCSELNQILVLRAPCPVLRALYSYCACLCGTLKLYLILSQPAPFHFMPTLIARRIVQRANKNGNASKLHIPCDKRELYTVANTASRGKCKCRTEETTLTHWRGPHAIPKVNGLDHSNCCHSPAERRNTYTDKSQSLSNFVNIAVSRKH